MFRVLDEAARNNESYCGFHCIVFENTSPDDGGIYLDGKFISTTDLIEFLQFSKPEDWYQSWFPKEHCIGISFSHT